MPKENSKVRVPEFDLESIGPNTEKLREKKSCGSKVVIIGMPGTGKSTIIDSILYEKKHILPCGIVMCGTESDTGFYKKRFPPLFIYTEYNEDVLIKLKERQEISKRYLENPSSVVIIDDCTDDPKVLKRPIFQNWFKNGRHKQTLFILSLQYCMDVLPSIRTAIDVVFILRETNLVTRKKLWLNFAGCIPDFESFCEIMDQVTGDRTALVINNTIDTNDWKQKIFWYKADPNKLRDYTIGCEEFWKYSTIRCKESAEYE